MWSRTASSVAISCASRSSLRSSPTTSSGSRGRSTTSWHDSARRPADTRRRFGAMLLLHEIHTVAGRHEDEFEAAFRDGWMPTLARDDDARLLYFLRLAHGTGRAYHTVTITGLRDGAAYERLATRVQRGDLRTWAADLDRLRHEVAGKILLPVDWSPMGDVDLATVPTDGREHDPVLYME